MSLAMDTVGRYERLNPQEESPWRAPASRDVDRILYSTSWRRLEGVTQVSPIGGLSLSHNRLTHSLKVAQVGQRTAEKLLYCHSDAEDYLDPEVVYAAGMAHDLGHPPFGHVAEKELQAILGDNESEWALSDSFEGNAQTFRIVAKLAVRKLDRGGLVPTNGLNLTRATLAAILKYPWTRGLAGQRGPVPATHKEYYSGKWGAYDSEKPEMDEALRTVTQGSQRSIEAAIMDFADDVTYAIHDVEDYFRAGLIPLHEIGAGFRPQGGHGEFDKFWAYAIASLELKYHVDFDASTVAEVLKENVRLFPVSAYEDSTKDRLKLHAFASGFVELTQKDLRITRDGELFVAPQAQMILELLKELAWYYVINHPNLATSQEGQRRIVRNLHEWLCTWMYETYGEGNKDDDPSGPKRAKRNARRLPSRLETLHDIALQDTEDSHMTEKQQISRSVVDYICSLTDAQTNDLHAHLGGYVDSVSPVSWLQRG